MLALVVHDEPADRPDPGPPVAVWRDDLGRPFARAFGGPEHYTVRWDGVGALALSTGSTDVSLWPQAGVDRDLAIQRFTRIVQPVVLQALGRETLHASAVRTSLGALAFCGLSGSGKSTIAYALGQRDDIDQIADDALVIEQAETGLVRPMPFLPRLRDPSRAFFDAAAGDVPVDPGPPLPCRAIYLLAHDPAQRGIPHIVRVPPREAFVALLRHAHCFDAGNQAAVARMARNYLALADRVPVYTLTYARDFSELPRVVDAVLDPANRMASPHGQP